MIQPLTAEELSQCCDPSVFTFSTTAELPESGETIGQERALRAIDFGLNLDSSGFNIFTLGENGTGKMTTIKAFLGRKAAGEQVPPDWCYVYNFRDPDVPLAVSLSPGRAVVFQKDMDELVKSLRAEIPKVFESKEYEKQKNAILEKFQKKQKDLFTGLEEEAQTKGFSIRKSVSGLMIVPMKKSGDPLTEEEYEALDEQTKAKIDDIGRMLQEKLNDIAREVREGEKGLKSLLAALEREAALAVVGHLMDELKVTYKDHEKIAAYLGEVTEDILNRLDDFKTPEEQAPQLPFLRMQKNEKTFTGYLVNVMVSNAETSGAPCVYESNPTYFNLLGRMEYRFQYGMATTDFSLIKAGALHRANGGYLVINALDMLKNMFSYDALKRALRNREIRIEDVWEQYRMISTTTIRPEAIPLSVKVILTGTPDLYYLLHNVDDEYRELFKVKADFDSRMDSTADTIQKYAAFVASTAKKNGLLPFEKTGVAKIVEYGTRLSGNQKKLSSRFSKVGDLIKEADYWARQDKSELVRDLHVERALREKTYRSNRIEERIQEMIVDGTIIVDTAGGKVGQINGLAVLDMGDYMFGKPSRITANTYAGKGGVVNIERETKMSGKIHEKAILIISHYINSTFARNKPISFSASITFEQLYDMVEGDSASCAELFVILSSLSGMPLKQSLAVTGSMDQHGDVQPIGGVNEKIEGYFDLCRVRGLDGNHGVVIPRKNLANLMLKQEVIDAVRSGMFTIYAISRVEEGIEIFTGMPAGEPGTDGTWPEGTLNSLVMKRLEEIGKSFKDRDRKEDQKEKNSEDNNS